MTDFPESLRDPDKPLLDFTFERVFCSRHGEPFRANWPSGYPTFMLAAWEKTKLMEQAPPDLPLQEAMDWAKARLDEQPLCCRFTREELLKLYLGARKWKRRICGNCRQLRDGTRFQVTGADGQARQLRHVCLWCVVYQLRPADHASEREQRRFEDEEERG